MDYIEKNNDIERTYSVYYKKEELKKLLDDIIKKSSCRVNGAFTVQSDSIVRCENGKFISCSVLPNEDPAFENIKNVYSCSSDKNECVTVEGVRVIPPELAFIIYGILKGDTDCINKFVNYPTHSELIPIERKISMANDAASNISNFDFDEKIKALNILRSYCERKKMNQYYNVQLLQKFYLQAQDLIELKLINERQINKMI